MFSLILICIELKQSFDFLDLLSTLNIEIKKYKLLKLNLKYVIPASSRFTAPRKKQIFVPKFPKTKEDYNNQMNKIILNPVANQEFLGMTYLYHADAIQYPLFNYQNIENHF